MFTSNPSRRNRTLLRLAIRLCVLAATLLVVHSQYRQPHTSSLPTPTTLSSRPPWAQSPLRHRSDGHAIVRTRSVAEHPIERLIEEGKEKWAGLVEGQPTTVQEAARGYKERYGRNPPKGYEKWFAFVKLHNLLPFHYDLLQRDTDPYLGISPSLLSSRLGSSTVEQSDHFYLHIPNTTNAQPYLTGPAVQRPGATGLLDLLRDIAPLLPPMKVLFSAHDHLLFLRPGAELRQAAIEAAKRGTVLKDTNVHALEQHQRPQPGWSNMCPLSSPLNQADAPSHQEETASQLSFITNHLASADVCDHPHLQSLHGAYAWGGGWPEPLVPSFGFSKLAASAGWSSTPMQDWTNTSTWRPWDTKEAKLFWRGRMTGDVHGRKRDWRKTQRFRLHFESHQPNRTVSVLAPAVDSDGSLPYESYKQEDVSERWMDVSLAGDTILCENVCEEIDKEIERAPITRRDAGLSYKYLVDVDGNGWSGRFHSLLNSGSVVLKSTLFPEWYMSALIPWYHYIPINVDYSDLPSVLAFFLGTPFTPAPPVRDELAHQIAKNAKRFAEDVWNWHGLQAYNLLALLEYARVMSEDRLEGKMDFTDY